MADRIPSLAADGGPDDLPRTFRREREAREREAREREAKFVPPVSTYGDGADQFRDEPQAAVVTALKIPFFRLMFFCIKLVLAGIPALILLGAILWGMGQVLTTWFPWIVKMKILITFPN